MEPSIMFEAGEYYVGDPGFVLHPDDLRMLFVEHMRNRTVSGLKPLVVSSRRNEHGVWVFDPYWVAVTPFKQGTIFDDTNKAWGVDWGFFGVVPWKWLNLVGDYPENKIEFLEPFECSETDDGIKIGHLQFTFFAK